MTNFLITFTASIFPRETKCRISSLVRQLFHQELPLGERSRGEYCVPCLFRLFRKEGRSCANEIFGFASSLHFFFLLFFLFFSSMNTSGFSCFGNFQKFMGRKVITLFTDKFMLFQYIMMSKEVSGRMTVKMMLLNCFTV